MPPPIGLDEPLDPMIAEAFALGEARGFDYLTALAVADAEHEAASTPAIEPAAPILVVWSVTVTTVRRLAA